MNTYITILCLSVIYCLASRAHALTLVEEGQSRYVIAIPAQATKMEKTAANELQNYLAQATGATLPIASPIHVNAKLPKIIVGNGVLTRTLLPELDPQKLPHDTIVIQTVGDNLVICGHPKRGTMLAVTTFLEKFLGVRWWTMNETYVPSHPTFSIPSLAITYSPPLTDRATRYLQTSDGCFTNHSLVTPEEQRKMGIFSSRLRLNGHDLYSIPPERGGVDKLVGWVHTFYQINGLLPPKKYFKDHPEWYSLINGKRSDTRSQLCLTNQEMRKEIVRIVLERLRENPDATMISISQNDWKGNCECEKCRTLDEREGSPSGSLIDFINAIAKEVEKEFPNILIETLAYQYTRKPPKNLRPRHNVIVRLCSIECDFSKTLEDDSTTANGRFREDIEAWSKISKQLYIWDYITNFHGYLLPHPNFHVLAPNLRFFVNHKATGIFEQGDSGCRIGCFVRLRAWYVAHLLWNPDADEKALFAEFMNGYYGDAAPHLSAYIRLLSAAGQRTRNKVGCFTKDTSSWLTLEDINQAMRLFDKALKAVSGDAAICERIRRERAPLDHVWLRRYEELKNEATREKKPFLGPKNPDIALSQFRKLAEHHQVGEIRQGHRFPKNFGEDLPFILRRKIPAGKVPDLCAKLPADRWFELQEADYIPRSRKNLFTIIEDPAASNGFARRMPNTHTIWACHSYPLGNYGVLDDSRWHAYMQVRCDAATDLSAAITLGVYDDAQKKNIISKQIKAKEIRGKSYQTIDLGTLNLGKQAYAWAAPIVRQPDEVEAVFVDRIFFIRED